MIKKAKEEQKKARENEMRNLNPVAEKLKY